MNPQVRKFLMLFVIVVVTLHVVAGGVWLASWLGSRHHASGSAPPPATHSSDAAPELRRAAESRSIREARG